jgi:signal transduction histidine kinase
MIESGGLTDFLEAFHTHRATLGWERMIHHEGSASTLVLHGSQTPCGILVFGYSTPRPATLQNDRAAAFAAVTDSKTRSAADEDAANLMFTVVHDLKNPISSIISSCEYLREYSQENLNPAQLEIIAGIESSASTLLQLSARLFELGFAGNDDANSQGPGSSP